MNKTFKVNYLAKDFGTIREELKKYAKRYYSNELADLSEASINSFLIDSVAYVGDVLSYYIDYQANESFLSTAIEGKNVLNLAKSLGYKPAVTSTSSGLVAMFMLVPSDGYNSPDYASLPIIKKGTSFKTADGTRIYLVNEDIVIDENLIGTDYVVARTNTVGNPTFYAIKFYVPVISGELATTNIEIDDFVKFRKVTLSDFNAVEIISVVDSEENEYYEVQNLSQNVIYRSVLNRDSKDSSVRYILKTISAQRRFVFNVENNLPTLTFGAKQYRPDEDLTINPITEPTKFVINRYNNDFLQDNYFEPHKLLNGDSFGVGPENTTLTITYRKNSSQSNSAATGEVVTVENLQYEFKTVVPQDIINTVIGSVQVINEEPIVGESEQLTINEIKDLAGIIYQAQNRAVTAKDYEALIYMMPAKYGSIKRAKAERDPRSLKNNINIYLTCADSAGSLVVPNTKIKENLKTWLSEYKMITDTIDLIDAKIINLGINYTILVDPNFDKLEVYNLVQEQLAFIYANKSQIGQSFNKLDVYREIQKVDGVLDIKEVNVRNITEAGYSSTKFDVLNNTTEDGNVVVIPRNAIYEVRFPTIDIAGKVV
jgi:hypothetical protein